MSESLLLNAYTDVLAEQRNNALNDVVRVTGQLKVTLADLDAAKETIAAQAAQITALQTPKAE